MTPSLVAFVKGMSPAPDMMVRAGVCPTKCKGRSILDDAVCTKYNSVTCGKHGCRLGVF